MEVGGQGGSRMVVRREGGVGVEASGDGRQEGGVEGMDVGGTDSHPSFRTVWDQQAVLVKGGGRGHSIT